MIRQSTAFSKKLAVSDTPNYIKESSVKASTLHTYKNTY